MRETYMEFTDRAGNQKIFFNLFMILQMESGQNVLDKYLHNYKQCLKLLKN